MKLFLLLTPCIKYIYVLLFCICCLFNLLSFFLFFIITDILVRASVVLRGFQRLLLPGHHSPSARLQISHLVINIHSHQCHRSNAVHFWEDFFYTKHNKTNWKKKQKTCQEGSDDEERITKESERVFGGDTEREGFFWVFFFFINKMRKVELLSSSFMHQSKKPNSPNTKRDTSNINKSAVEAVTYFLGYLVSTILFLFLSVKRTSLLLLLLLLFLVIHLHRLEFISTAKKY